MLVGSTSNQIVGRPPDTLEIQLFLASYLFGEMLDGDGGMLWPQPWRGLIHTNPRARIIPGPKSIDQRHKRRIVPPHLNPGMSPGFLFESFPANTHGGQQMPSKLYVGNLAYSVTNDDLEALFSQVGKVATLTRVTAMRKR